MSAVLGLRGSRFGLSTPALLTRMSKSTSPASRVERRGVASRRCAWGMQPVRSASVGERARRERASGVDLEPLAAEPLDHGRADARTRRR